MINNQDHSVRALVLTGFGMNCDYETQYVFTKAGAVCDRVHINRLIEKARQGEDPLDRYHILAVGGGFAWGDDHGAGVILGVKLRNKLGEPFERFIAQGKLIIGICNGFQALVNMGLLPGFDQDYKSRQVALTANDCGNFSDQWVRMVGDEGSKCIFTKGIDKLDLPIRHGEGKFYAAPDIIERLNTNGQVALRYARPDDRQARRGSPQVRSIPDYLPAGGQFPFNPNGSLDDIAGICDETGRIFGLMPHPEGFHQMTNHPDWTGLADHRHRWGFPEPEWEGDGMKIFRNAVDYAREHLV